ncbi:MAG: methionine biosynthesis protein MetW [Endomicrobiaceae bacterium]
MSNKNILLSHLKIADIVDENSTVLDLGCGNGDLMDYLEKNKNVNSQGVEISEDAIYKCVEKGLCVLHSDIDGALEDYPSESFDFVILSQSLQQVRRIDNVLEESLRIGKKVIIAFPNFAHVSLRIMLFFKGIAPVTKALPDRWNDTPNIRFLSIKDFENFCAEKKYKIIEKYFISNSKYTYIFPNLFAQQAVFVISKN